MTCSTALALDDVMASVSEVRMKAGSLISMAIASENDMVGASTGGLDQNASMRCQPGNRLDCRPGLSALENVSQQDF